MEFQDRVHVFAAAAVLLLLTPFVAVGSPPSSNVGVQPSGVGDDSAVYPQQPPSGVGDDSAVYLPQPSSGVGDDSEFDDDDTDGRLGTDAAADSSLPPLPVTLSFASPPLLSPPSSSPSSVVDAARRKSVHEFTVKDLDGNDVSLSRYKGRVLLIVNYARLCGLQRHNVENLSNMAKQYAQKGLKILMFPSNSFMQNIGQTGESLKASHPEFDVFSPVIVNTFLAFHEDPLYAFLKSTTRGNRFIPKAIRWNFTKFLVDRNGRPVERYDPLTAFSTINEGVQNLLNSAAPAEVSAEVTSQPIE